MKSLHLTEWTFDGIFGFSKKEETRQRVSKFETHFPLVFIYFFGFVLYDDNRNAYSCRDYYILVSLFGLNDLIDYRFRQNKFSISAP